jgi:hypothetical protein
MTTRQMCDYQRDLTEDFKQQNNTFNCVWHFVILPNHVGLCHYLGITNVVVYNQAQALQDASWNMLSKTP